MTSWLCQSAGQLLPGGGLKQTHRSRHRLWRSLGGDMNLYKAGGARYEEGGRGRKDVSQGGQSARRHDGGVGRGQSRGLGWLRREWF